MFKLFKMYFLFPFFVSDFRPVCDCIISTNAVTG